MTESSENLATDAVTIATTTAAGVPVTRTDGPMGAAVIDGTVRGVLETIVTAGVETVVTGKGQGQIDRKHETPRHRNVVTLQHHATTTRRQDTAINHHGRENHPRSQLQNPRHFGDKKIKKEMTFTTNSNSA